MTGVPLTRPLAPGPNGGQENSVELGVYYKRHSIRGYVLYMFTTYGCAMSRLQYCTACLRLTDSAIV